MGAHSGGSHCQVGSGAHSGGSHCQRSGAYIVILFQQAQAVPAEEMAQLQHWGAVAAQAQAQARPPPPAASPPAAGETAPAPEAEVKTVSFRPAFSSFCLKRVSVRSLCVFTFVLPAFLFV